MATSAQTNTNVANSPNLATPEVAKTMMQSSPLNFRRVIIWIGRLVLGGIFMYAGYSKIFLPTFIPRPLFALKFSLAANLSNFAFQVESYKLLSPGGVSFVAHTKLRPARAICTIPPETRNSRGSRPAKTSKQTAAWE